MDVNSSYLNADSAGRALFEELDNYTQSNLLAGSEPQLAPPIAVPLANDTAFEQFSVVGLDANGKLALAVIDEVTPANSIQAIGVLAHAASLGAAGSLNGQVFYQGCFNIGADSPLVFDASFDTEAKKAAAFNGAGNPTQIVARRRQIG